MDSVLNSTFNSTLQELYFDYGCTQAWEEQMRLLSLNPILYLRDYRWAPEDVVKWKMDEELYPEAPFIRSSGTVTDRGRLIDGWIGNHTGSLPPAPSRLCTGIGTYHTEKDGELYLCVILARFSGIVLAYSFGVYRSAELVGKALENFFCLYEIPEYNFVPDESVREGSSEADSLQAAAHSGITLLSSQNPLYQTKRYTDMLSKFPLEPLMTQKGSRGQAADVSTFYSQLMRKKGKLSFHTWQDGIEWLSIYLLKHNLKLKYSAQTSDGRKA